MDKLLLAFVLLVALFAAVVPHDRRAPIVTPERTAEPVEPVTVPEPPPTATGAEPARQPDAAPWELRYVAIGGGVTPESTEVSLEQNLLLAQQLLPGPGKLLFAGGTGTSSVRTIDRTIDRKSALVKVGDFFAPRSGRKSRYRAARFDAAQAKLVNVESTLMAAFAAGDSPLLVYIAAHGDQGETARDNMVMLWSGAPLTVSRVAELHDQSTRPVRMLVTSCFSGGFAELAFKAARASDGIARAPRCGLFAGTWDRETSGCDPNPDRRAQESYSLHALHALRGQDRDGKPLDLRDLDLDGDGKIGLLDAHTRARIASDSIDVPTTTSERYLREVQRRGASIDLDASPEDAAVVAQLGMHLGLATREAVDDRLDDLTKKLDELDEKLTKAEEDFDKKHAALASELLGRWPVLSDAYHPDFQSTLASQGAEILALMNDTEVGKAYAAADTRVDKLDARYANTQVQEAVVTRLARAYETLELATALAKRGGALHANYVKLRACERLPL